MNDYLGALQRGSIGFFYPTSGQIPDLNKDDAERGHLRIEDQVGNLEVLVEDVETSWLADDTGPPPVAVIAVTTDAAAVLLDVAGPYRTHRFGGLAASSAQYQAGTIIGKVDITRLRSTQPVALHASFHGVSSWIGLTSVRESFTKEESGVIDSVTLNVKNSGEVVVRITGGRHLVLSTAWSVEGPSDQRTIRAPVAIGCVASRPRPASELLRPLIDIQNLLNLAFGGFVVATPGTAQMHELPAPVTEPAPMPWVWNGMLMVRPEGLKTIKMSDWPLFDMATLGGPEALRRWIAVAARHPRAVTLVVNPYRIGVSTAAVTLLEAAAGIEYWVNSHRKAKWSRNKNGQALALATKVGGGFSNWVGDAEGWAREFRLANNGLKHDPSFSASAIELADLAVSGRYLLAAALLDQVARSKAPSRAMFRNHRLLTLGHRLQGCFK